MRAGSIKAYCVTVESHLPLAHEIPMVDEAGLPVFENPAFRPYVSSGQLRKSDGHGEVGIEASVRFIICHVIEPIRRTSSRAPQSIQS